MSTTVLTRPPTAIGVTQARVVRSEWTKFRSLRSTAWTLLAAVVFMVGIGAVFSAVEANQFDSLSTADRATFDAISTSLNGITFAQLAIGVLGVLLMSAEYSTGMIRSSLTVVPRRLPVLWAKLGVTATAVFVVSLLSCAVAFFVGQALLGSHGVSLGAPGALRSVVGAALYLTLASVIGVALGALLRNTAAGISTFVGAFFVIPPLLSLLPGSISDTITPYLPSNAGAAMFNGASYLSNALSPWTGFAVVCGYAAVLVAAAAWRLQRSDA